MATWKERTGFNRREIDNLYHRYRCFENTEQNGFASLEDFIEWAASEKYAVGMKLERIDAKKPYSRDNCVMAAIYGDEEYQQRLISMWESVMKPIRERFKRELEEIERRKPKGKEYFQYEHPDLVREGIVFEHSKSIP